MCHHQDRRPLPLQLIHPMIALRLEENIPDGEGFIDDQHLRIHGDVERKGEPDEHSAGIGLHRLMDEVPDIREIENCLELLIHLLPAEAHHRPVHIDILDTGIILIEAGPELQERADRALRMNRAEAWAQHAGNDLKDRRLPGAVRPDDPHRLPLPDGKADVV